MKQRTLAHFGLLGTNLFFAINLGAIKYFTGNQIIRPYGINVVRIGGCVLLFWLFFLASRDTNRIERKDILKFILCAFTALALNVMLFVKGLSYTFSIHASLLLLITPILITFIAAWVLKERITSLKIAGLLLGVSGAFILISSGKNTGSGENTLLGDMLILMSATAYTIYFILVKPLMKKYRTMEVMRWMFTFGFIMILPLGWSEFTQITWSIFGLKEYLLILFIVVPGTFLAYLFNVYGIKTLGASIAGAYIYSQPVFAVTIATLFLKEDFEQYKIIAAVLIFAGVYFANKQVKND